MTRTTRPNRRERQHRRRRITSHTTTTSNLDLGDRAGIDPSRRRSSCEIDPAGGDGADDHEHGDGEATGPTAQMAKHDDYVTAMASSPEGIPA